MNTMQRRWEEIFEERLMPEIVLASFYVCPGGAGYKVKIPGVNTYLILDGTMEYHCSDGTHGIAGEKHLVTFYSGINRYSVCSDAPLSIYQVVYYPAPAPFQQGVPALREYGKIPHDIYVGEQEYEFVEVFEKMMETLLLQRSTWHLEASSSIMKLLALTFSSVIVHKPYPAHRLGRWERLLSRIEVDDKIPEISVLAREMNITVQHFINEFYRVTGNTPKQYILHRRLWKAKNLLMQGMPVKEAAYKCGFNDPLYFSRAFKKYFTVAPSSVDSDKQDSPRPPGTSLPVCRHLTAPGVDMKIFSAK
ncbi:MAG: helix-turn-helix transcriptional regulator [Victivallales bacterium]|nr:helix-turn-helix transcriptional regulator [Victivallales bacterium]